MNNIVFDVDRINAYLLGALSEEDAGRLDELSFTDDAFTEALHAAEIDLHDAYVHDDLSQAERKQFESHYLSSPLRRERVNFAHVFKEFGEGKRAEAHIRIPDKPGFLAPFNVFWQGLSPMSWGIAAATVLLAALGVWWLFQTVLQDRDMNHIQAVVSETPTPEPSPNNSLSPISETEGEIAQASANEEKERLEKEIERKKAQELERIAEQERVRLEEKRAESQKRSNSRPSISVATFILLPPRRGAGQLQQFTIPEKTEQVSFQIELEAGDYPQYRVDLSGQGSDLTVWQSRWLKASAKDGQKSIVAQIPSSRLTPRIYTILVYGVNPDGASEIIGDYSFRVMQ